MITPASITPIIKLTEICNYTCRFCRYANHPQKKSVIQVEDVKKILLETVRYNVSHGANNIKVIYHGGEPLLFGIDRFIEIMLYEEELSKHYSVKFINSIQTNGYLLDDQWVELLKRYRFSVGISLDGPGELNGHYGKYGNEESEKKVLSNIQLLKNSGIPFGVLSVITNEHTAHAKAFYDYWLANGVESIGLCFCYNPEDQETVDCDKLSSFLIELFDLYFMGTGKIDIREFNNAIQKKLTNRAGSCTYACREKCGSFLTLDPQLRVLFCDDYDLNKSSSLGNLAEMTFEEIVDTDKYQKLREQSRQLFASRCNKCSVKSFCGGGCARNDTEHYNYFCPVYKKVYSHISECLESYNISSEKIEER